MGEIIFHVIILGGLGLLFRETFNINLSRVTDIIGPAGFPRGVIAVGFALTCASLFQTIRTGVRKKSDRIAEANIQFLGIFFGVVIFIFLSEPIGFLLASILLVAGLMALLGQRSWYKIVAVPILTGALFTVVFGRILSVPLPRGMGIIRELSFWIF